MYSFLPDAHGHNASHYRFVLDHLHQSGDRHLYELLVIRTPHRCTLLPQLILPKHKDGYVMFFTEPDDTAADLMHLVFHKIFMVCGKPVQVM